MFAVLPIDEYRAFELMAGARGAAALTRAAKRYATGEEETILAAVIDRSLAGDAPMRVWREHRGLTAAILAELIDVTPAHIPKLETGRANRRSRCSASWPLHSTPISIYW